MTAWPILRVREGARWLFRGTQFDKLEGEIDRIAAPLARHHGSGKAQARRRRRVKYLISCLPPDRAAKYHDTLDRYGHSVRN